MRACASSAAVALCLLALAACPSGPTPPDVRDVAATGAILDPTLASTFWDLPWPSDARVGPEGAPDLATLPNPGGAALLERYRVHAETALRGFGTASPTYLRFDGPVTLPPWTEEAVEASARCEGPVRILDVDPDSPARGTCVPARWSFYPGNVGDPFVPPNGVAIAPYWGFPLRGATTYAVYLVDLPAPGGFVRAHRDLQALLEGAGPEALRAAYAPLAAEIARNPSAAGTSAERPVLPAGAEDEPLPADGIDRRWIAHATVFTTQDVLGELRDFAEYVATEPDLVRLEGTIDVVPEDDPNFQPLYALRHGTYRAPNFQRGEIPYATEGGGLVRGADGRPEPQLDELIPFAVSFPREGVEQPASGWPVILHQHGTGGDEWSHLVGSRNLRPGLLGANRGFLSIGIPQPFHGDRWPGGTDSTISILSFNFNNPESGRSTFRQGALDLIALERFVAEEWAEGGAVAAAYPDLRIDPDRIYFLGHSQGGLTGALALPFARRVQGFALSGTGGGLTMTVLQRTDPVDFQALLVSTLATEGVELDDMHPVLGIIQMLVEATDPLNYGRAFYREPEGAPRSVLLTEGIHDAQTPADTSEALAVAAGLPVLEPYSERVPFGLSLRGLRSLELPVSGNVAGPDGTTVTAGLGQFDSDHFAIFSEATAAQLWSNFLQSQAQLGPPGELGYDP